MNAKAAEWISYNVTCAKNCGATVGVHVTRGTREKPVSAVCVKCCGKKNADVTMQEISADEAERLYKRFVDLQKSGDA